MAGHTQGKLKLMVCNGDAFYLLGDDRIFVTKVEGTQRDLDENRANARRLVACWNALDGIPTEDIEKGDASVANPVIP